MKQSQINFRISADLKENFQRKVKAEGLDVTTLMTQWIENYMKNEEIHTMLGQAALTQVTHLRGEMNEKLQKQQDQLEQLQLRVDYLLDRSEQPERSNGKAREFGS